MNLDTHLLRKISAAVLWGAFSLKQATPTLAQYTPTTQTTTAGYAVGLGISSAGTQAVGDYYLSSTFHAALWGSNLTGRTDLSPTSASYAGGAILATNGSQQTGEALYGTTSANVTHAALWSGTAASFVDLNPAGSNNSVAFGTNGANQAGFINLGTSASPINHAVIWAGSSSSYTDLNGSYIASAATGIVGSGGSAQEIGYAELSSAGTPTHAIIWMGTASSALDLNPTGAADSALQGTDGTHYVGIDYTTANPYAALWTSNSASSFVNLNPAGYTSSEALAVLNGREVGDGYTGTDSTLKQALLWRGSAASVVDLQSFLPNTDTWVSSSAQDIDAAGDVFGYAKDQAGVTYAVLWKYTAPAPDSLTILMGGAVSGTVYLVRRRRAKTKS